MYIYIYTDTHTAAYKYLDADEIFFSSFDKRVNEEFILLKSCSKFILLKPSSEFFLKSCTEFILLKPQSEFFILKSEFIL